MERQTIRAPSFRRSLGRSPHPWLYRMVFGFDAWLRHWNSVFEYSDDPRCVFRIQISRLEYDINLADGTSAPSGSRIINLHFWNEHVPFMPKHGPTIAWARQMCFCFKVSLNELQCYLEAHRDLDDISVIRGNSAWGVREQSTQMARLCQYYGFEMAGDRKPQRISERAHRLGDTILMSLFILALSGGIGDVLHRDRVQLFASRKSLGQRTKGADAIR
jgi:hypothetical protein